MCWQLISIHSQRVQHILPVADSLPHQEDGLCLCEPDFDVDYSGWIRYTHRSYDGREEFEQPLFPEFKLKVKRSH